MYQALMEEWAECPPICISVMAQSGVRPKPKPQQPGVNPMVLGEAASDGFMQQGKPFIPSADFERALKEFSEIGRRHQH